MAYGIVNTGGAAGSGGSGGEPSGSYVPTSRKINDKSLDKDITLTAEDVNAVPTTRTVNGLALSEAITLGAEDVGAIPGGKLGAPGGVATLGADGKLAEEQRTDVEVAEQVVKSLVSGELAEHNESRAAHMDLRGLIARNNRVLTGVYTGTAETDDYTVSQTVEVNAPLIAVLVFGQDFHIGAGTLPVKWNFGMAIDGFGLNMMNHQSYSKGADTDLISVDGDHKTTFTVKNGEFGKFNMQGYRYLYLAIAESIE